jgi:hypothetical protein
MKRGGHSWRRTKPRIAKRRQHQRVPVTVTISAREFVETQGRKLRDMEPEGNA